MHQRHCVVLYGDRGWCEQSTRQLLVGIKTDSILCLSDDLVADFTTLKIKQAKTQLGREFDAVVFDGVSGLLSDNLGQSVGTVKAGGHFILWLALDDDRLYTRRFSRIIQNFEAENSDFYSVHQGESLPELRLGVAADNTVDYQTDDQAQAVKAILKVAQGHRRRPLVLSADRGRGKSAALGMAAAHFLAQGERKIILTAPSLAAVTSVFKHAAMSLDGPKLSPGLIEYGNAELRFIAPDALLATHHQGDLLLVDEAAVIPSAMLAKMLHCYSRIVFATTLHGYEGTGRGFAVRFQALLTEQTPGWRHIKIVEPVRWRSDDQLEAFSFEALLLDAEPVDDSLIIGAELDSCSIEVLDKQTLLNSETQLRQLFGLMVLAHYRTRPSDLQLLLDSDDITFYVVRYQGHIVASVWLVDEGLLTPDLSAAIYRGERRLKGHLLPQSLLAHNGLLSSGPLHYHRVLRLAVHPVLQRKGLATALVKKVIEAAKSQQIDIVGTSFSTDIDVMSFWRQTGFSVVRLGTQRDEVSGQQSVILLRGCSARGQHLVTLAKDRFERQWPDLLAVEFNQLDVTTALAISAQLAEQQSPLSDWDREDVMRFAQGQATYESCQIASRFFVSLMLGHAGFLALTCLQQKLLMMRVLQVKSVKDVVKALEFRGKSDLTVTLRQSLNDLLIAFSAEDRNSVIG